MVVGSNSEGFGERAAIWLRGTNRPPRSLATVAVPHLHWDRESRQWREVAAGRRFESVIQVPTPQLPAGTV